MSRLSRPAIGILIALYSFAALAQEAVRVTAMNYPAWLVRNYETLPLLAGSRLQESDLIRTGEGGRVRLQLADAGEIYLGESLRFVLESLPESDSGSSPKYSFQALRGVFRMTNRLSNAAVPANTIEVRIGAITAAARNADFWGRSDLKQDLVCLVEGTLAVDVDGESSVRMNQAFSCYVKPRDQSPLPVDLVDRQQHQLWLSETELDATAGIAAADGEWQLVLISLTDSDNAAKVLKSYHELGFAAQRKTVVRGGRILHRLLLPGFVSIDAALNARARVEEKLGISDAWVWKAN